MFLGLGSQCLRQHLAHQLDAGKLLADAVVQVLADAPLLLFADVDDLLLQPAAVGDVEHGADNPAHPAAIDDELARALDVPHFAVRVDDAILELPPARGADAGLNRRPHEVAVVGVDVVVEELVGQRLQRARLHAEDAEQLVGPVRFERRGQLNLVTAEAGDLLVDGQAGGLIERALVVLIDRRVGEGGDDVVAAFVGVHRSPQMG